MTAPTRAEKFERIEDLLNGWDDARGKTLDDIDKAILSDYDDLTPERRAELRMRAVDIQNLIRSVNSPEWSR